MMNDTKTKHVSELNIPEASNLNFEEFDEYYSSINFNDPLLVRDYLVQHFLNGEHDTFFEILSLYADYVGKSKISKETNIPERTIYNFINGQHKTSSENIFKIMKYISDEIEKKTA